jgi:hypothetical protein
MILGTPIVSEWLVIRPGFMPSAAITSYDRTSGTKRLSVWYSIGLNPPSLNSEPRT